MSADVSIRITPFEDHMKAVSPRFSIVLAGGSRISRDSGVDDSNAIYMKKS